MKLFLGETGWGSNWNLMKVSSWMKVFLTELFLDETAFLMKMFLDESGF